MCIFLKEEEGGVDVNETEIGNIFFSSSSLPSLPFCFQVFLLFWKKEEKRRKIMFPGLYSVTRLVPFSQSLSCLYLYSVIRGRKNVSFRFFFVSAGSCKVNWINTKDFAIFLLSTFPPSFFILGEAIPSKHFFPEKGNRRRRWTRGRVCRKRKPKGCHETFSCRSTPLIPV